MSLKLSDLLQEASIICSIDMPWDQLGIYMYNLGYQVMPVQGDGFCFLNAIDLVLNCDHIEVVTQTAWLAIS